jgi:hypothetical protein
VSQSVQHRPEACTRAALLDALGQFVEDARRNPRVWSRAVHGEHEGGTGPVRVEVLLAAIFAPGCAFHDESGFVAVTAADLDHLEAVDRRANADQIARVVLGYAVRRIETDGLGRWLSYFADAHESGRAHEPARKAEDPTLYAEGVEAYHLVVGYPLWDQLERIGHQLSDLIPEREWWRVPVALAFLRDSAFVREAVDDALAGGVR